MLNLEAVAAKAMQDAGFEPHYPPAAQQEARRLEHAALPTDLPDLRHLLWSSVDNTTSRDLDQIEVAERLPDGDILLRVGIAEVDWCAPKESALDRHAAHNTTTVYTGVHNFNMFPEVLSCDRTSLLEGQDRVAMVVTLRVNPDGTLQSKEITRALVRNRARLSYEGIGPWLEGRAPLPPEVAAVPGLEEQLHLQDETMERFLLLRLQQGALNFDTVEATPITENGKVVGLTVVEKNRARLLIESFMVAVNTAVAALLHEGGLAAIQRIVRAPQRWDRIQAIAQKLGEKLPPVPDPAALSGFLERRRAADPDGFSELSLSIVKLLGPGEYAVVQRGARSEGHFGLAVQGYTHSTAPNRRYVDVVTQRLLKALLAQRSSPYTPETLATLAAHCTERARAADKVERRMRKLAATAFMQSRIGEVFPAVVTGASAKGVFVRLKNPPVEGRVVRNEHGLDVGDRPKVRLIAADPHTGFIDFEQIGHV